MSLSSELHQVNHRITLEQAIALTTRYRDLMPEIVASEYAWLEIFPVSETFKKSVFAELLSQPGAVAVRIYLGMSEQNLVRLIFVAVNDDNQDILPANTTEEATIFEYGQRCPPICAMGPLGTNQ